MKAAFASDLDELRAWVDAVRALPRFLRTKDARALFDELAEVDVAAASSFDDIAARIGRSAEGLIASLRKCPFGVG